MLERSINADSPASDSQWIFFAKIKNIIFHENAFRISPVVT
jgi:hypothetical protein